MEDYKTNSHKSKDQSKEIGAKKRVEKVVTGNAQTIKKSGIRKFSDIFVADDLSNIGSYILNDIVVPAVKNTIYDTVTNGLRMFLRTDDIAHHSGGPRASKISYTRFYDRPEDRRSSEEYRNKGRFDYEDILFPSRADAEMVLTQMDEMLERYPTVTVLDMYDAAGITAPYTADKYGWTDIHTAKVVPVRGGGYMIKLPKAFPID